MKNATRYKNCHKTTDFYTFHIDKTPTRDTNSMHHSEILPQNTSCLEAVCVRNGPRQCCTAVKFQPPCSPDLSPLDFFLWNELKTQLVHHPALANPAELRALSTRVYHGTWTGGRWMFEKIGAAWVRTLKVGWPPKADFWSTDMADHIVPLKDTAQKHVTEHVN